MSQTELTPAQELKLEEYRTKYMALGLSTDPANRALAEDGINRAYDSINQPRPKIIWATSPVNAHEIIAELEGKPCDSALPACWGGQDLAWLATYEYINKELNVTYTGQPYQPVLDVACNAGWWYPFEGTCIVCERPSVIKMQDGRLHCATGPAIAYADGKLEVYSWRGTTVPKEWITDKDTVDPALALNHPNIEQRRCLAEILGWARVLDQLDAVVVNEDADPMIGVLLEAEIPDAGKERFLRVRCGTGRDFVLPVPPEMQTALEANAWTYGLDAKDLRLEVRT